MSYRLLSFVFFIAISLGATAAPTPPGEPLQPLQPVQTVEGITEYRLANGLQVLLVPDDSKPTTTVNMTYHVGSRYENYGETGMAHLLEHLMFQGSTNYPTPMLGEFTKRGLRANGSTSYDRTNYFASFAANADTLKWYLDWQADAMVNSFIARKSLDSEMTVVRNEMERGENNPQRIMIQRASSELFDWHNYGKDTIGARSDVENVDIPRLQAFYREYYQPDNATLVISGQFDPAQTLVWVQEAFGKIAKPTRKLPMLYTLDPVQDGERSFTLQRSGGVPLLLAGFHVPSASDPDYAAAEALALILADEPSGRLYTALVKPQLAASIWGGAWDLADPGFMMFGAVLAPGQDIDKARSALLDTTGSFKSRPVTAEELERAKVRWLNDWKRRFTNPEAVGIALSSAVGQGDWRLFFLLRDRVRDLKVEDVQRVAVAYLVPSNRVVGTYLPTENPVRAPVPKRIDVEAELKGYKGDAATAQAAAFDPTPANIDAQTITFALPSGMQVALLPKGARGEAVKARLTLRYGDEKSLFGSGDVPEFTAALLDHGTPTMTRQQIQDRFEALQADVGFGASDTAATVAITTTRENLPAVIVLVGDILRSASFPAADLDELRHETLAAIEAQRKEPAALVQTALARHDDPYPRGDVRHARSFDERVEDAKAVTIDEVRAFHARFYGANHAQFSASGEMDAAAVKTALDKAFGDWASSAPYARVPTPLVAVTPERILISTPDKQNATVFVQLALPLSDNDPDYATFTLANRMLGQGGNSRLWDRIRQKEGLSYDVGTAVDWSSHEPNSMWQAWAIFAPQNRPRVEAAFREEVTRALKDGFTQSELDASKKGLLSARRLVRAQDSVLAAALNNNLYLGRTFAISQKVDDQIAAATLDSVNSVLRKYLKPEAFVIGFGGDFKP
ncbi:MAG: pitrilysin family protein [Burkholderiales bacterium]